MTDEDLKAIADLATRLLNSVELLDAKLRRLHSSLDQLHRDHAEIRRAMESIGRPAESPPRV